MVFAATLADDAALVQVVGDLAQGFALGPHALNVGNNDELLVDRHQLAVSIGIAQRQGGVDLTLRLLVGEGGGGALGDDVRSNSDSTASMRKTMRPAAVVVSIFSVRLTRSAPFFSRPEAISSMSAVDRARRLNE